MIYDVFITEESDYLRADVSGQRSTEGSKEFFLEFFKQAQGRNVLIVFSLTGEISILDMRKFSTSYRDLGIQPGQQIAMVDRNQRHFERQQYAVDVAYYAGASVRLFRVEKDAVEWLSETSGSTKTQQS